MHLPFRKLTQPKALLNLSYFVCPERTVNDFDVIVRFNLTFARFLVKLVSRSIKESHNVNFLR